MAGFSIARKAYLIVFPEDHDLHGLELTMRAVTLAERRSFVVNHPDPDPNDPFARLEYEVRDFLKYVISWNLEDENDEKVDIWITDDNGKREVNYEGFARVVPLEYLKPILTAFHDRALGNKVSEATEKKSETGDSTETTPISEASLPMEPLP